MGHVVEHYEEAEHVECIQDPSKNHQIVHHEEEGDGLDDNGDSEGEPGLAVVGFDVTVDEAIELFKLWIDLGHDFIVKDTHQQSI